MQGTPLRHPLIFYYAHTAAFFVNKAVAAGIITERVDPEIEFTCAIGVDEMSWDDLNPKHYNWPSVSAVREYRVKVRALVDSLIRDCELSLPVGWESPFWVILMGIEHERIHLETSSVLFRQLPLSAVQPSSLFAPCPHDETPADAASDTRAQVAQRAAELRSAGAHIVGGLDVTAEEPLVALADAQAPAATDAAWTLPADLQALARAAPLPVLKAVPSAVVEMGKPADHPLYGWDNEYGHQAVPVPAFKATTTLVSNQLFLAFLAADGYHRQDLWTAEGWAFAQYRVREGCPHPEFWVPVREAGRLAGFRYRLMGAERAMPWSWPADLNCLEAKAVATWLGQLTGRSLRLPAESEWMRLREHCIAVFGGVSAAEVDQPYWRSAPGNVNLEHYASSAPVDEFCFLRSGFYDVVGNVWQHCETAIAPLPGFRVHPVYDDFTVPTFDGLHSLIKGGSWISTGNEATAHARYAFRRHFYQHAGARIVEAPPLPDMELPKQVRVEDPALANAAHDHYFDLVAHPDRLVGGTEPHPVALARAYQAAAASAGVAIDSALVSGCSAGRAVFELAHAGARVVGLDATARALQAGVELSGDGVLAIEVPETGSVAAYHKVDVRGDLPAAARLRGARERVTFLQGDVCNLSLDKFDRYDVVAVQDIEQKAHPARALATLSQLVQPGGLLMVAVTGAWDASVTAPEEWLGGHKHASTGETVTAREAMAAALPNFTFVPVPADVREVTCSYRQSRRVYSCSVVEILCFRAPL